MQVSPQMYIDATISKTMPPLWLPPPLQQERVELLQEDPRFFIWVDQYPPVRLHSGWAYQLRQQFISLPGHLSWHGPLHEQFAHVPQRGPRDKSQLQIPNRGHRQYHSFTGHSPILLHKQLKLARAARGLPGDHGPSKKDHSFPSSTICLLKVRLVVTNPAVRRGTVHIRILDTQQPVLVDFTLFYSADKIVVVIVNCFLSALDGWVPPCPFHPVPRIRCKLAAFPKRAIILYFFLHTSSRPEIKVVNRFWVRCCGRVA